MKWEALALAVLTQTLQVGLRPRAEPTPWPPSYLGNSLSESHCHRICKCGTVESAFWFGACGFVSGACLASVVCLGLSGRAPVGVPSPRRKGHGILSEDGMRGCCSENVWYVLTADLDLSPRDWSLAGEEVQVSPSQEEDVNSVKPIVAAEGGQIWVISENVDELTVGDTVCLKFDIDLMIGDHRPHRGIRLGQS